VSDENVFEHVATDGIYNLPVAQLIHDVDHAGLLLITLGSLAVQVVQIERDAGA
jgi:hypothetical protein